jgi:hypothetical protein
MFLTKSELPDVPGNMATPFGPGPRREWNDFEDCVGTIEEFSKMKIGQALDALDEMLYSFLIETNSSGSALEAKAHKSLGIDGLRHLSRDSQWLNHLLDTQVASWGDATISVSQDPRFLGRIGASRRLLELLRLPVLTQFQLES